jgi:LytS/YehU family sensor histidine kinase
MDIFLLGSVIKNIAVLGVAAYITAQLPPFRRALNHVPYRINDQLILILIFGFFSGVGNYLSIPVMGSLAHTRIVGVVAGGLLGGPVVGVGAGIIGAIPRYFMGGDVALTAMAANVVIGLISGMFWLKHGARNIDLKVALLSAVTAELILKTMVIMLTPSLEYALQLERAIAAPTIIATCFGVALFIYIVRDVFKEQEKVQAEAAQHAMRVIRKASGVFRYGLNETSAQQVAELIYTEIKSDAVSVTNKEKVLAFIGQGADHHIVGQPFITRVTKLARENRKTVIVNDKSDIGCPSVECPLCAVVDAPLLVNGQFCGSIKLYKAGKGVILPYEAELIQGIADFLSLELLNSELEAQNVLLAQAEYNSLKAQIHPHFLFNTLGTIRAIIRSDPDKARALIKDLSALLRRHLTTGKEVISIKEELECVATYIRLEQARFGERIKIIYDVLPNILIHFIPIFSIQVLVENAVKHGLSPKKEGGTITIKAWRDLADICIMVEDNGVGISADKLKMLETMKPDQAFRDGIGIGLQNVHARLQTIYGKNYGICIESIEHSGTKVSFCVPIIDGGEKNVDLFIDRDCRR